MFRVEATDGDSGGDGEIVYAIAQTDDKFIIESRTGIVRLRNKLDRETDPEERCVIYATDMSEGISMTGTLTLTIDVLDENDNAPTCQESFISKTIIPPVQSSDVVVTLSCTDKDAGANGRLSFTIIAGNTNSDFAISSNGDLILTRKVSNSNYRLEIEVSDNGTPSLETIVLVNIITGGVPRIVNLPDTVFVPENIPVGTSFFNIEAESISEQLDFKIRNITGFVSKEDAFSVVKIDRNSGSLYTWQALDREVENGYTISVIIADKVSLLEISETFDLQVLDDNDNIPGFENHLYNISVMENISENQEILKFLVTDADLGQNSQVDFQIVSGNEAGKFIIDGDGRLTTKSTIDREEVDIFTLKIIAKDRGIHKQLTGSTTVIISVLDTDEYDPEFTNIGSDLDITLSENTPLGARIVAIKARDLDVHRDITFRLETTSSEHFFIDKTKGDIYLSKLLDRETSEKHYVVVTATGQNKSVTATVTISVLDVNDNAPAFKSNVVHLKVNETTAVDSIIGNFVVNDNDSGDNAKVYSSITNGNIADIFAVDNKTDEVISLVLKKPLKFDDIDKHLLTIEGHDYGTPRYTSTLSVFVEVLPENRKPKFAIDLEVSHIPENIHFGKVIYDADASPQNTEEDNIDDIVYSIEDGNVGNIFSINKISGEIYVVRPFQFNKDPFLLLIWAQNIFDPRLQDEMTLKVFVDDVNDHSPVFTDKVYNIEINENTRIGTSVGQVMAYDDDQEQNAFLHYELLNDEDKDIFQLDTFKGIISLKTPLDYNETPNYEFRIIAFDQGTPSRTGTTTVIVKVLDVNNHSPVFDNVFKRIEISEKSEVGKVVGRFEAFDSDSELNGKIHYVIVSGNSDDTFGIRSESGLLKISKPLDRETIDQYELTIEARDNGLHSLTGTMTLSVVVGDANDNYPRFEEHGYYAAVNRFASVESHVATVKATDLDEGRNAEIEYRILPSQYSSYFQINPKTGSILTFSDISIIEKSLTMTILAVDNGYPQLSASVVLTIDIGPSLYFDPGKLTFYVSEFALPTTFVGTINGSTNSKLTLIGGNYNNSFLLTDDGTIFVNNAIDREQYPVYVLQVKAVSKSSARLWKDMTVHIVIKDENDNDPVFSKTLFTYSALEHSPVGYKIGKLEVTDLDSGENGRLTVKFGENDHNANKLISVDPRGTLTVRSPLSFEFVKYLNFTVYAYDNGVFSRSASASVYINIIDVKECTAPGQLLRQFGIINFEIPIWARSGHQVGCLRQDWFGIKRIGSTVKYLTDLKETYIEIDTDTGCVVVNENWDTWKRRLPVIEWVAVTGLAETNVISIVRVDTFIPNEHVVVLYHAVSADVLELHRYLMTQSFLSETLRLLNIFKYFILKRNLFSVYCNFHQLN